MKNDYLLKIKQRKKLNNINKNNNELRIATYNVHYWTDVYEYNKYLLILEDISSIDADIIFLQEVLFGSIYKINGDSINTTDLILRLEKMGYYIIFCNILPTWYNGLYGNMFCVKNEIKEKINSTNYTLDKLDSCYSGNNKIDSETRCYIILEYLEYLIVGVHLDVCNEDNRYNQMNNIMNKIDKRKKVVILGDFNSLKESKTIKYIKNNNFKSIINTDITVWSGIQCDYIFTNFEQIEEVKEITGNIYYTENSDHLPLYISIKQ